MNISNIRVRPGFGVATGFIVDKQNGIILTNR
jgi:hypothetical protein